MHLPTSLRLASLAAAALLLAACSDKANPVRAEAGHPPTQTLTLSVTCTASVVTESVRCGDAVPVGGASAAILGGQHQYVTLSSSNAQTIAPDTFQVEVMVTNLIPQPLGTADGETRDLDGIRVFFTTEPAATAGGTVTVANPDGVATFTAADQPYFEYPDVLDQNEPTAAIPWKFHLAGGATTFTFTVLVSAAVQFPDGYVFEHPFVLTLDPGETRTLGGGVFTFRGDPLPTQVISWSSDEPEIASVSGGQVTAVASRGFATLTASSGIRPGTYPTSVSVCPATVVTNGTSLPSRISPIDCYSSYGSMNGTPTTQFYADLYRVSLVAGQTLEVTMDSGDDLDTYLLLAGPTYGELVMGNDDDDDDVLGVGSRLIYTAPVSGVYVIEASTFDERDTGDYTLGITIS